MLLNSTRAMCGLATAVVTCLAAGRLAAEPNLVGPAQPAHAAIEVSYDGYIAGLNAMKVHAAVDLRPDGYDMGVNFRTSGLVGAFTHGDMNTRVNGSWSPTRAVPNRYVSAGVWRGLAREAEIDYPGGQPQIKLLSTDDEERDAIPASLTRDTTDAVSAVAFLLHTVATTGKCEGHAVTYDGHRLTEVTAKTIGMEVLPQQGRSSFSGPALRCDLEGRQTAGFPKDAGPDDLVHKLNHSTVWLLPAQGSTPPVPVQMTFEVRLFGQLTIYLTDSKPGAPLGQFTPKFK